MIEARVPGAGRSAHITSGPPRTHPCNLWAQRLRDDQPERTVQATWTSYSGWFRFILLEAFVGIRLPRRHGIRPRT